MNFLVAGANAMDYEEENNHEEGGEGHHRDSDVAEGHHEALRAGFRKTDGGAGECRGVADLQKVMIPRDYCTGDGEREDVIANHRLFFPKRDTEKDRLGVHQNALVPAELAGREARDFGVEQTAERCGRCDNKRKDERV